MAFGSLYVRGMWTADRAAVAVIAAIIPPLFLALAEHGTLLVYGLITALVMSLLWQFVFAWSRRSPLGWDWVSSAAAFIVLMPTMTPLWQIGLAVTFGIVVGEQIFGGRGRGFLSPAAVALAFLFFSFPTTASVTTYGPLAWATVPGALMLVFLGLISWRVLLAAFAGVVVAGIIAGIGSPFSLNGSGSFVFALVFLGCDPMSAAATNAGRILYGFLIGVLTVVFGGAEPAALVFAVLLASIFAPIIDHIVVWIHAYRRRRSIG